MRDTDRERAEANRRALADQERLKRSNEAIDEEIERMAANVPYERY